MIRYKYTSEDFEQTLQHIANLIENNDEDKSINKSETLSRIFNHLDIYNYDIEVDVSIMFKNGELLETTMPKRVAVNIADGVGRSDWITEGEHTVNCNEVIYFRYKDSSVFH